MQTQIELPVHLGYGTFTLPYETEPYLQPEHCSVTKIW